MSALIKFLSGSQNGAEAVLEPGSYVLGSSNESDLLLVDAAVRPRHAALTITDSEWRIEALDGAEVRIGGRVITEPARLEPLGVITLGGIHIAIGPDADWPALPEIPQSVMERAEQSGAPEVASPPINSAPAAAPPARPESKPVRRDRLAAMILVLAVAAAGAWLVGRGGFGGASPARRVTDALERREIAVAYPAAGNLRPGVIGVATERDGTVSLSGLLPSKLDRDAVLETLGDEADRIGNTIRTVDEDIEKANASLALLFPGVTLTRGDAPYSARITGLVKRVEDNNTAFRLARESLDSRIAIKRGLHIWPVIQEEADRELRSMGIVDARFRLVGDAAELETGSWPGREQRAELLRRLEDRYGELGTRLFAAALTREPPRSAVSRPAQPSRPLLPDLNPAALPPAPPPKAPLRLDEPPQSAPRRWVVQRVGKSGFIDQQGEQHAIGDILGDGMRIIDVWQGGVVLQRGQETIFASRGSIIIEK